MSIPAARTYVSISACLFLTCLATYYMRLGPAAAASGKYFEAVAQPGEFSWPEGGLLLRRHYTGIAPLDFGLSFLVAAFFPGVRGAGMNGAFEQQQPYFLTAFTPIIAAFSVEAGRPRNAWSIMSFTTIWGVLYQTVGGAIIVPLWFAFYFYTTSRSGYWQQPFAMSAASAQGLFFAIWLGFIIPTVAIYLPGLSTDTRQLLVALWQPVPIWVNIIWAIASRLLPDSNTERPKEEFNDPTFWVKSIHSSAITISIIFHWIMIYNCFFSKNPDVTFVNVHIPLPRDECSMSQALHFIFQIDFWIIIGAALLWCYISVGDLFELGMTNIDAGTAGMLLFFIANILGPGAAISLTCIWKEDRMRHAATKSEKKTS